MSEVTFKSAEPISSESTGVASGETIDRPDSVVVPTTAIPKTTNIPLEQWNKENNKPYSTKFFDTETPFDFLPAEVQGKMRSIDKFVDREISDKGLRHNTFNYEQVLSDTLLELGILDGDMMEQVDRIYGYAQNILKLDGLDEVRLRIKSKMRKMQTSKDMTDLVLKEIGKKII